jgi:hypothetical protein
MRRLAPRISASAECKELEDVGRTLKKLHAMKPRISVILLTVACEHVVVVENRRLLLTEKLHPCRCNLGPHLRINCPTLALARDRHKGARLLRRSRQAARPRSRPPNQELFSRYSSVFGLLPTGTQGPQSVGQPRRCNTLVFRPRGLRLYSAPCVSLLAMFPFPLTLTFWVLVRHNCFTSFGEFARPRLTDWVGQDSLHPA